jgi:hypothetical protein
LSNSSLEHGNRSLSIMICEAEAARVEKNGAVIRGQGSGLTGSRRGTKCMECSSIRIWLSDSFLKFGNRQLVVSECVQDPAESSKHGTGSIARLIHAAKHRVRFGEPAGFLIEFPQQEEHRPGFLFANRLHRVSRNLFHLANVLPEPGAAGRRVARLR